MQMIFRPQKIVSATPPSKHTRIFIVLGSLILALGLVTVLLLAFSVGTASAHTPSGTMDSLAPRPLLWPSGIEFLSAGRYHTCYLNTSKEFICWGDPEAYPSDTNFDPLWITETEQVSAGDYATCALKTDGNIDCWSPDVSFDNAVITSTTYLSVSAGTNHACAIDANHDIRCWGDLGSLPALITGTYQLVSAGYQNNCAIRGNGQVECWGDDGWAVTPPSLTFSTLAVGRNHACGIRTDGSLYCWGGEVQNPPPVPPTGNNYTEIDSGSGYSCALDDAQYLTCWGPNSPDVDTGTQFKMFSSGFLHTCALTVDDGYLACWGNHDSGQAPRLALTPESLPAYLPQEKPYTATFTATGSSEGYLLSMVGSFPGLQLNDWVLSGTPQTAGSQIFSLQLQEDFDPISSSLPIELNPLVIDYATEVVDPSTAITIQAEPTETTAGSPITVTVNIQAANMPTMTGNIMITGTNSIANSVENSCTTAVKNHQATCHLSFLTAGEQVFTAIYQGDGFYLPSTPVSTTVLIDPATITPDLSAGSDFTCALDNTGQVDCWGQNDSGQTQPPNHIFSSISAGEAHACGRGLNGQVYCWGWNGWGVASPPVLSNFARVTSGRMHSCGLHYDQTVSCWGNPVDGRTDAPDSVLFTQISAGDDHTCGIDTAGNAHCWGELNTAWQPGPFSSLSSGGGYACGIRISDGAIACWGNRPPFGISSLPAGQAYTALEAGRDHLCALDSNGQMHCWGDSSYEQTQIPDPTQTFSALSAGSTHTCALTGDGYLRCWGSNLYGQAPVIEIIPAVLPTTIDVGEFFTETLQASGGRVGVRFIYELDPVDNDLPPGLQLDANSGNLYGTPTQAGNFSYQVQVTERDYTPAFQGGISFSQWVRSDVSVQITNTLPFTGMAGLPVQVFIEVDEVPGDFIAATPSLTVTVTASDSLGCELQLNQGRGSCFMFFNSNGDKLIQTHYAGDVYFKPGETTANISIDRFTQTPEIISSRDFTLIHQADGSLSCLGDACQGIHLNGRYPAVGASESQVCVIQVDGQALCQDFGATYTVQTHHPGQFVDIHVGSDHVCAHAPDGRVSCWGDRAAWQSMPLDDPYLVVRAGEGYTCAILADGSLNCWGASPTGTLPTGPFTALETGPKHACALHTNGSIACWGKDAFGQSTPPENGSYLRLAVGDRHSCALRSDGQVVCWGDDIGNQASNPYGKFTALAAAADHSCALREGVLLTCWGINDQGEAPQIEVQAVGGPDAHEEIPALTYWEHAFYPQGGAKPYRAEVVSGNLPLGTSLGISVSPAGTILYGTPPIPDVYPFVLHWQDAAAIPLVFEAPYTITVTGMDLAVELIPDHPTTALYQNEFGYEIILSNQTALPVTAVTLTLDLPAGFSQTNSSGLPNCTQTNQQLQCTLNTLPGNSSQTLNVTGLITALPGTELQATVQAESGLYPAWPELAPENNLDQSSVLVSMTHLLYEDDFDHSPPAPFWSDGGVITAPTGINFLGVFTDTELRLSFADLIAHQRVMVAFDVYMIGAWDGTPGIWQFGLDGETPEIFTTFSNLEGYTQAFPDNYPFGVHPARTGAAGQDELGYPGDPDTRYRITTTFIHNNQDLVLLFKSLSLPADARWGIDNVRIVLDGSRYAVMLPVILR